MYKKLTKCAAKTVFEIQSYIPRTHEMNNRILSKNKGCLFFLPSNCPNITWCLPNFFLPNLGGRQQPLALPVSYTYGVCPQNVNRYEMELCIEVMHTLWQDIHKFLCITFCREPDRSQQHAAEVGLLARCVVVYEMW